MPWLISEKQIDIIADEEVVLGANMLLSYSKQDPTRFSVYDYSMVDTFKKKYGKKSKKQKKAINTKEYQGGQDVFLADPFDRLFMNRGAKNYTELFVTLKNTCPNKGKKRGNRLITDSQCNLLRTYIFSGNVEFKLEIEKPQDFKIPLMFMIMLFILSYHFCLKKLFLNKKK